jgi:hypothetical protein
MGTSSWLVSETSQNIEGGNPPIGSRNNKTRSAVALRQHWTLAEFGKTPFPRNAYAKTRLFLGSNRRQ